MSEFQDRVTHFYEQTDRSIKWPNSAEGDLLKIGYDEINAMRMAILMYMTYHHDHRAMGLEGGVIEDPDESINCFIEYFHV